MRVPPWAILVGGLAAIAVVIVVAVIAAGGDDTPSAATESPTPTRVPEEGFGPTPTMTDHIHKVTPEHAGTITQAETVELAQSVRGICAEVTYEDLPQNNLSFQMAFDDDIVTQELTLLLLEGTEADPIRGLICYATEEGLPLGVHSAAVAVQDPNNLAGPPDEVVGWKFEVIE